MCGIIGIVGSAVVTDRLVAGLKRLEYRGYDSSGVAVIENDALIRSRAEGKLSNLQGKLDAQAVDGHIGIAHTRWATHGVPNETNAHPHFAGRVGIVHNGIIENFLDLRQSLNGRRTFSTETDTEVVAHLIDQALNEGHEPKAAFQATLKKIVGAYALCVLIEGHDDHLYAARSGAPLAIGIGDGEMYVGSDATALTGLSQKVIFLEEGDWAVLSKDSYQVYDRDDNPVERPVTVLQGGPAMAEKGNYRHFMLKEIYEQPETVGRTLTNYIDEFRLTSDMPEALDFSGVSRLIIIALFIAVSQSGETADTLAALRYCKEKGLKTAALVNVMTSTMAREADIALPINAGPEIGVASTKAFTSQLTALAALVIAAASSRGAINDAREHELTKALTQVPRLIKEALALDSMIERLSFDLSAKTSAFYLGRGVQTPIAFEGALKLKEISYIHAEGYAAGELKHGPIALIEDGTPVIVIAPHDTLFEKTISNLQEVASRGAQIILITDTKGAELAGSMADELITLPDADPFVAPLITSIAVQLLAYHSAVHRGTDVDQPRNLAKSVTVAGFGTRVLPATKTIPKEMLPVVDRPALQYVVDEAIEAGIEHFVFVTGRNKGAIEDYFDRAYELEYSLREKGKTAIYEQLDANTPKAGTMSFVRQQSALGLGHAIWCARDVIGNDPFAILLPDVLVKSKHSCLAQMVDAYNEVGGNIIAVDAVPNERVSSYGVIAPDTTQASRQDGLIKMTGMVEKPPIDKAPSNLKITGRYILQPEIMHLLKDQEAGAGGEIQLTDAMARMMKTQDFHALEYVGQDYDCGSKYGYFEAVMAYAMDHNEIGAQARALIKANAGEI